MYWNFVAIDGVKKNQINTQQDATLKGKNHFVGCKGTELRDWNIIGKTEFYHTAVVPTTVHWEIRPPVRIWIGL
jgi:hypothetical protein